MPRHSRNWVAASPIVAVLIGVWWDPGAARGAAPWAPSLQQLTEPYVEEVFRLPPGEAFTSDDSGDVALYVGPYGEIIALKTVVGGEIRVYRNGTADPFRYKSVGYLRFSPTGRCLAYFGVVDNHGVFIRDGTMIGGKLYPLEGGVAWNPRTYSVATVAYEWGGRARGMGESRIMRDGILVGYDYDATEEPTFSPDGKSFAFLARSGDKWLVVRGGVRVGELYDGASCLTFTPDSRSVMFVARVGDKSFVVKDGSRVSRRYKGSATMVLGPSGRSYALTITEQGGNQYVVKDDRRVGPIFDEVFWPTFARERDVLVFQGRLPDGRFIVVKDGKVVGGAYETVSPFGPAISHDGSAIAFRGVVRDGAYYRERVIKDGQCIYEESQVVEETEWLLRGALPCLSADGRSVAYDVEGTNGPRRVMWDGKEVGEDYDRVDHLMISPDGRTLLFRAHRGGKFFYVSNGRRVCQQYTFVTPPVPSRERKVIFAGVLENAVYRNEVPW